MVNNLPVLKRLLNMAHIVEEGFADTGFGIDDVSAADDSKGYLPTVA